MKNTSNWRSFALPTAAGGLSAAAAAVLWRHSIQAGQALPGIMAFPFAWVGQGLRALSLAGTAGNLLAWGLYLLAVLCPIAIAFLLKKKGHGSREDGLLAVCSVLLVPVLYGMINPGLLRGWFAAALPAAQAQGICGASVWVCLLSWGVLRVMRALPRRTMGQLLTHLDGVLTALSILLVMYACGMELYELLTELDAMEKANTALSARQLLPTRFFMCFHYFVNVLPTLLTVGVLQQGRRLLQAARTDRYSEEAVEAARTLAERCRHAVSCSVLALLVFALTQLAFASRLYDLEANVTLPLSDIAVLMGTLVFARWMVESKALKDENEGFI